VFKSFFQAGFECTTGYNRDGEWIDLIEDTWHHRHVDEDYRRLRAVGMAVARDAIRWPVVDRGRGRFDFASVRPMVAAARKHGLQVIWDLFHYGYPAGMDPLSDGFADRFARYCGACARFLRPRLPGPLWFTPVNEPSYMSWAAGDVAHFPPYLSGQAQALKIGLVRAAIRGIDAIRDELPDARFVNADPLCHVTACDDSASAACAVRGFNESVFEAWDMMAGRLLPELGGSLAHLDVVGINYYWNCQWVYGEEGSWLEPDDPRRVPLRDLVQAAWCRYGNEVVISETSHWGEQRAIWLDQLAAEVESLLQQGVPLRGVCLYPILGMRDWHAPRDWMPMGLWDIDCDSDMRRVAHQPMLKALVRARQRVQRHLPVKAAMPGRLG
jgi:hypothetical protein